MYLRQSCPHHTSNVLSPLWDVRIVLIKSWREWQQQRPEELCKKDNVIIVTIRVLLLVLFFINQMCSFVFFHLATYTLKLIALQDIMFAHCNILFIRIHIDTILQKGPRGITLSWDGKLHIHITCIAPIKVLWRLSAPLTFNSYNFWVLHYGASRSNLDRNLVFSLSLKCVSDASLQGYNGLDFKRKKHREFHRKKKIFILSAEYRIFSTCSPWHTA